MHILIHNHSLKIIFLTRNFFLFRAQLMHVACVHRSIYIITKILNWILSFLDLWVYSICLCILLDFFAIYLAKCNSANSSTKLTVMNIFVMIYILKKYVMNEISTYLYFFSTNYFKRWIANIRVIKWHTFIFDTLR